MIHGHMNVKNTTILRNVWNSQVSDTDSHPETPEPPNLSLLSALGFQASEFKVTVLWNVTPFVLVRSCMMSQNRQL